MWLISSGKLYEEGEPISIYKTKTDAIRDINDRGYEWNLKHTLYINYEKGTWMSIEKINTKDIYKYISNFKLNKDS